jgi:hypothetical protein
MRRSDCGLVLAAILAIVPAAQGLSIKSNAPFTASATPSRDTSLFVAVLRELVADTSLVAADQRAAPLFRIDPRPVRFGMSIVTPDTRVDSSTPELLQRIAALRAAHIRTGNALLSMDCAGVMSPGTGGKSSHKNCPKEPLTILAISEPASGDVISPKEVRGDARLTTTRVIVEHIGPGGIVAESRDYVFRRTTVGWQLVTMRIVGYFE